MPLDDPLGRGVFAAGAVNTRRYRIRFPLDPEPEVIYGYAVDASWAAPIVNPPVQIPADFPIEANQPEAFLVQLQVEDNTLFYDFDSGQGGGVVAIPHGCKRNKAEVLQLSKGDHSPFGALKSAGRDQRKKVINLAKENTNKQVHGNGADDPVHRDRPLSKHLNKNNDHQHAQGQHDDQ